MLVAQATACSRARRHTTRVVWRRAMLSSQQHGHGITLKAGCSNIELAIPVDVSEGQVICARAGAERRAGRRYKRISTAEQHCDAVDGGHDDIISPVPVDIRNCEC